MLCPTRAMKSPTLVHVSLLVLLGAVARLPNVQSQRTCPNGFSCPSGQVCCPGVGTQTCAANVGLCPCNYAGNCPTGSCCNQEYSGVEGTCTKQPVLANGTQVCPNCRDFNGVQCPNNQICCPNGACADSEEACGCDYAGRCPSGFCCTTESSEPGGHCTNQPVLGNGTQICPNCNNFNGLQCPNDQVCCPNGACADSEEACGCTYYGQCPSGFCCTSYFDTTAGHCTNQPVLANGTQVCPNCQNFNGLSCPNDQVCCPNGACADSVEGCGCEYTFQCPTGFCCTTDNGQPGGHCTSQVFLANGTQACPDCNRFAAYNDLSCPSDKQLCCPSGSCAATEDGCTCGYASQCPFGYCCTTNSNEPGGHCTSQVIQPGGIQACPNCRDFVLNGLNCPDNGLCCPSGKCAKNASLCNTASGGYDPHFELTGLEGLKANEKFMFDFHGEPNKTFCMISDATLQINVHMFGLTDLTKVLKERVEEVETFFTGTWMDGLGFLYLDTEGQQQEISITFDPALDRAGKPPFSISFNGENLGFDGSSTRWSSSDGFANIRVIDDRVNAVTVSIGDALEMEVEGDFEKELIADPPIHFINFRINKLVTSIDAHGFLGQMYVPGAIEDRLAMGTLEGLLHREYVEGTDQEYETPGLTDPNCSFKRFGQRPKNMVEGPRVIGDNSAPLFEQAVRPGRRLLVSHLENTATTSCHLAVSPAGKGLHIVCQ